MADNPVMKILKDRGAAPAGLAGRYSGEARSAAWLEENLGAAGLTKREKASQYYVPGIKTTAGSATSRGASGVTMAQVMALPDTDVDKLTVMNALTQAEADAKVYAKMLSAIPKRMAAGEDPVNVAASAVSEKLSPADENLFAGYAARAARRQAARRVSQVLGPGLGPEGSGAGDMAWVSPGRLTAKKEDLAFYGLSEDADLTLF